MYQTDDEGKKNLIRRRQNYISTKSGAAKSMSDENDSSDSTKKIYKTPEKNKAINLPIELNSRM